MARILIVEDEIRIASFLAKGLGADGHAAVVADDGLVGLDHALSGEFDLMVLDIGLPGMDGFELLDQLRLGGGPRLEGAPVATVPEDGDPVGDLEHLGEAVADVHDPDAPVPAGDDGTVQRLDLVRSQRRAALPRRAELHDGRRPRGLCGRVLGRLLGGARGRAEGEHRDGAESHQEGHAWLRSAAGCAFSFWWSARVSG